MTRTSRLISAAGSAGIAAFLACTLSLAPSASAQPSHGMNDGSAPNSSLTPVRPAVIYGKVGEFLKVDVTPYLPPDTRYTFALDHGSRLIEGLHLDSGSGIISGVPTEEGIQITLVVATPLASDDEERFIAEVFWIEPADTDNSR